MKNGSIKKLTVASVMLALSFVLSFVKVWQMPLGGSVTLCSMLPVCLVAIMYGSKWGFLTSFAFALTQLFISLAEIMGWGLSEKVFIGTVLLDYLLAFTLLGFAGIFRKKGIKGMICGVAFACVLRFLCHFVSGIVLFANLEQYELFGRVLENRPVLYSLCYNGFFMLPEMIFTLLGITVTVKTKLFKVLKIENE